MCDHMFTVLAKKATKYSIMAVSRAASDEGDLLQLEALSNRSVDVRY